MSRTRPMRSMARTGPDARVTTPGWGIVRSCAGASAMEPLSPGSDQGRCSLPYPRMPFTTYTLGDFDFSLPDGLIAQQPVPHRSASRLLDGRSSVPADRQFRELPSLLQTGDLLVCNDTRVIKARLFGEKPTGGALEALVERVLPEHRVIAQLRVSKAPR